MTHPPPYESIARESLSENHCISNRSKGQTQDLEETLGPLEPLMSLTYQGRTPR